MATQTPWGKSDSSKQITRGIMCYSTPSHGGYHLSRTKNLQVHSAWRHPEGWYEEDCDWSIVVQTFPQFFLATEVEQAKATAKNWLPLAYQEVFGEEVQESESFKLRELNAYATNANRWVVLSAWGDWHPQVPKGKVAVVATKGGARQVYSATHELPKPIERYFMVSKERYDNPALRSPIGYLIDESEDVHCNPIQ